MIDVFRMGYWNGTQNTPQAYAQQLNAMQGNLVIQNAYQGAMITPWMQAVMQETQEQRDYREAMEYLDRFLRGEEE